MPFLAANTVPCIKCHTTIPKGAPISWTRGKSAQPGVYHVICPVEVPAGVTIEMPQVEADMRAESSLPTWAEPTLTDTDDDDLPVYEDEPAPGTRAWFATATMADRETQLILASADCVTLRDYNKVVVRYSTRLSENETKRFRRYARGVWAGLTARIPADDDVSEFDARQRTLFEEPSPAEKHGEETQAWRSLVAEWSTVPA